MKNVTYLLAVVLLFLLGSKLVNTYEKSVEIQSETPIERQERKEQEKLKEREKQQNIEQEQVDKEVRYEQEIHVKNKYPILFYIVYIFFGAIGLFFCFATIYDINKYPGEDVFQKLCKSFLVLGALAVVTYIIQLIMMSILVYKEFH